MRFPINLFLTGICLAGVAGIAGCDIYAEPIGPPPPPGPEVGVGVYYDDGWYDGPYWVRRDRDGHYYHEMREFHERREHEFRDRGYARGHFEGREARPAGGHIAGRWHEDRR